MVPVYTGEDKLKSTRIIARENGSVETATAYTYII